MLRVNLNVPQGDNCLAFDFRFLSSEFPELVNSSYSDAFIAELDKSTWTTDGSAISAPKNFASDSAGHVITIQATDHVDAAQLLNRRPFKGRNTLSQIAAVYCAANPGYWRTCVLQWERRLAVGRNSR